MKPADLWKQIEKGKIGPVYVLIGPERFLIDRAATQLREAITRDGVPGFDDDLFHAKETRVESVVAAARTLPMMATRRYVLLRDADLYDAKDQATLAEYVAEPSPDTCLVVCAEKLHASGKLRKAAAGAGVLIEMKSLKGAATLSFIADEAQRRGHLISERAASALYDAIGDDLSAIDDALERLSLYAGEGRRIGPDAVEACITRTRAETIWALVDAISQKNARIALKAARSLLAEREPPLRIAAMIARQLRMVAKARQALADGLPDAEAAKIAGAPPFKARELRNAAKRFRLADLTLGFGLLAELDLRLKGGACPAEAAVEEAVLRLCS